MRPIVSLRQASSCVFYSLFHLSVVLFCWNAATSIVIFICMEHCVKTAPSCLRLYFVLSFAIAKCSYSFSFCFFKFIAFGLIPTGRTVLYHFAPYVDTAFIFSLAKVVYIFLTDKYFVSFFIKKMEKCNLKAFFLLLTPLEYDNSDS